MTLEEVVGAGTAAVVAFPSSIGAGDVPLTTCDVPLPSLLVPGSVVGRVVSLAAFTVQEAARSSSAVHSQPRESSDNFILYRRVTVSLRKTLTHSGPQLRNTTLSQPD